MHSALSSVQSLHLGLPPSHFDFLPRQILHYRVLAIVDEYRR